MLAAEQIQQLAQLRQLMMAQINPQNVYLANQSNRDAQRAATQQSGLSGKREAPALPGERLEARIRGGTRELGLPS